jgi:uncharacterized protein YacL
MVLQILRALFVLLMAGVGWFFVQHRAQPFGDYTWLAMSMSLCIAVLFISIDILSPRKKLAIFSGTFLGLIVGVSAAYALSFVVRLLVEQYVRVSPGQVPTKSFEDSREAVLMFANICVGMVCCYLAISFILQTKDDFRFIIPYVEFSKQVRGAKPFVVDTSVIIDGRILDIVATGIIDSRLIVPRFVLLELQAVADSGDKLKRNRGRRGLDVLNKLQANGKVEVILYDWSGHSSPEAEGADQKLLVLAKEVSGRLLTNDFNLSKVAQVRGVEAVNINDLATAMRPVVLPGERMHVRLVKAGEEATQGVGYLEDGTMVVVEHGRAHLNEEVEFVVTNSLQTNTGRMIFGRLGDAPPQPAPQPPAPPQRPPPQRRPNEKTATTP